MENVAEFVRRQYPHNTDITLLGEIATIRYKGTPIQIDDIVRSVSNIKYKGLPLVKILAIRSRKNNIKHINHKINLRFGSRLLASNL